MFPRRFFVFSLLLFCPLQKAVMGASSNTNHWAYRSLTRSALPPDLLSNLWSRTPIDLFIAAAHVQKKMKPAAEADPASWQRRVYLDLTGLPPTVEERRQFLAQTDSQSASREVDKLLASPRYGERWARHWIDLVHFAETHGHDQDRIRTNAWPYRDYLIRAFNEDRPYSRFIQEQVAGDALFPDDPQATVALGMIAAGPWDESSLRDIREETVDRQVGRYLDRDDMVTTVVQSFASTTVHCARCHDHKFDPIPQKDYFNLQAVFSGVDRANRAYDLDPVLHGRRQALQQKGTLLKTGDERLLRSGEALAELKQWEMERGSTPVLWSPLVLDTFVSSEGSRLVRVEEGALRAEGPRPEKEVYTLSGRTSLGKITALQLELLSDPALPKGGPGRQDNGNLHLSELELQLFFPESAEGRKLKLHNPSADFNQDGYTVEHTLDRNEKSGWGIFPKVGESHRAVFELAEPVDLPEGARLVILIKQLHGGGHLLGKFRVTVSDAPAKATTVLPEAIAQASAKHPDRTEKELKELTAFVLQNNWTREMARLPKPSLVYAAASEFEPDGGLKPAGGPRKIHRLKRGEIGRPAEEASPGALSFVPQVQFDLSLEDQASEANRRVALARWLASPENPLVWRSIVNRVWQQHFGRGLVNTPNDFGKMGERPSHPELLDWLAVWFRDDAGGSLKKLHRLLVLSSTYRQSCAPGPSPDDPDNVFLSRMNRQRLDAEQWRDSVLLFSGELDLRMGGPSDQHFDLQPGHHVTPRVDYQKFDVGSAAAKRRGVYRFLFRTLPDPLMDALDCPAGDQLTPIRTSSVTVQQALAVWNDALVLHLSERFAQRLKTAHQGNREQLQLAFENVLGRSPSATEEKDGLDFLEKHGLANFCRVLFNLNEFVYIN